jgi:hypothetical protein
MKVEILFRDLDAVCDGVGDAVDNSLTAQERALPKEEQELLIDMRTQKTHDALTKWIAHGEYVKLAFDLDAKTATVLPRKRRK